MCVAPWPSSDCAKPLTSAQSSTCVCPRRRRNRFAPAVVTATFDSTQSRVRHCSIARSNTTAWVSVSRMVTVRSSSSPITSTSVGRCSKRRMFTRPVVITWPTSTEVTRVIGRKIRRRVNTSTTRPSTRGGWVPWRSITMTSRTLPT